MDAHALLTSQGWRGSGHSLHPTSDKTGLSRPLLVSKKSNTLGIGKKQHRTSDMWWMNAFDKSLKGLDTSKEGKVVQTVTNGGLDMVAKGGSKFVGGVGLYACFVRGESLSGTITPEEVEEMMPTKKRKRNGETKEERRARKEAKRAARAAAESVEELTPPTPPETADEETMERQETKEERRERRRQKKLLRETEQEPSKAALPNENKKKKKRRKDEV